MTSLGPTKHTDTGENLAVLSDTDLVSRELKERTRNLEFENNSLKAKPRVAEVSDLRFAPENVRSNFQIQDATLLRYHVLTQNVKTASTRLVSEIGE